MIVCKVCGAENEQGATFCGTCGSFLEWSGESVEGEGPSDAPPDGPPDGPPVGPGPGDGQSSGTTEGTQPGASAGAAGGLPPAGSLICPACGTANDPSRVFCSRCATELSPVPAVTEVTPASPEPRGVPPVAILGVVAAVALVGVLGLVFLLPRGGTQATPGASESAEARVTASASVPPASGEASGPIPSTGPSGAPSSEPSAPPQRAGLVVFSARADGDADLWTWDPATDTVAPLLRAPGDQRDPAWAPDGSAVVYRDDSGLRMITVDGDPYDPPDFTHHAQDRHPAWSPDGATVVFSTDRSPFTSLDLATRPADDNEAKLTRLTDDPENDWDPQWSPDGRQIVFVSLRDGHQHLWLMDADGGREREVDLGPGIYDDPMFSPDGEWLGFTRREQDTEKALYVARVDGSDLRRLTNSGASEADLAWSPDGATIAVVRNDAAEKIVLVDVASGNDLGSFGADGAANRTPDWWWPPK